MDKGHKAIACGVPRNRHLSFIDTWDGQRLLTYSSQKKAEHGFKASQFYLNDAEEYMMKEYAHLVDEYKGEYQGKPYTRHYLSQNEHCLELYEAVQIDITMETQDE